MELLLQYQSEIHKIIRIDDEENTMEIKFIKDTLTECAIIMEHYNNVVQQKNDFAKDLNSIKQ